MKTATSALDDIAGRLSNALPDELEYLRRDLDRNFRAILQSEFRRLGLVTREEFEVQQAVLRQTREKLEALEQHIREIEESRG